MTMGIYRINGPKNCVYFGSSVNVERRLVEHKKDLRNNKHHSKHMQRHYNKYGIDALTFSIVETVENEKDLVNVEQDYLDWMFRYLPSNERYNGARVAGASLKGRKIWLGRKHSDETKQKQSIASKGVPKSEEHKRNMGKTKVGNKNFLGKKHSEQTKEKQSNAKKGKASWVKTYVFPSPQKEITTVENLKKFCRDNILNYSCMQAVASGKNKQHNGWTKP